MKYVVDVIGRQWVDLDELMADDAAMLALCEAAWNSAGTAMPCTAEGGREGLLAALDVFKK